MARNQAQSVRRAQKESVLLQEVAKLFLHIIMDDSRFAKLSVHRVQLSPEGGMCSIYFYSTDGKEHFKQLLPALILYKPSLRKALAAAVPARHTPDLLFKFDEQYEKQKRIEDLLAKLKDEGQL